jgi:hypothetical protein
VLPKGVDAAFVVCDQARAPTLAHLSQPKTCIANACLIQVKAASVGSENKGASPH